MHTFFKDLFEYNHDCNKKIWDALTANPDLDVAVKLYCHILNAHHIWNNRVEQQITVFGVWDMHSIEECGNINRQNHEQSMQILDTYAMERMVTFKTGKGNVFTKSVQELLFHVINHSTYHRAQIASEFRRNGLEPLKSDFILFRKP